MLQAINEMIWGPWLIGLLLFCGLFYTLRLRFFQVTHLKTILKHTIFSKNSGGDKKNISPFQSAATALAGTIGTGNIAGVATAIAAGGPGSIFWMWVSGLFGMATKYAEVFLSVQFRVTAPDGTHAGGPMYYLERALHLKPLAVFFAVCCVLCSFGTGNLTQANSISDALSSSFQIPKLWIGLFLALLCLLVLVGGARRIAKVTEVLVPFMGVFYLAGALVFLFVNASCLPTAFSLIFQGAFTPAGMAGGAVGVSTRLAIRYGFARGVFTNEAGLGSAPIAHACSTNTDPVKQGFWGVFEVFFDTILMCSITALVILCADHNRLWQSGLDGMSLTGAAFFTLYGYRGSLFLSVAMVFFALAAMLGWAFYAQKCLEYLFPEKRLPVFLYRVLFALASIAGALCQTRGIWALADILNGAMALPNLLALLLLSPVVIRQTRQSLKH